MAPLPIVAAGVSAGATLLGGQAAMAAGRYQQSVSERNAAMYRMKADDAYRVGENNIKIFNKNYETAEAQTEIAYMKAGVKIGDGTPMEVLKSQAEQAELTRMNITYDAATESYNYKEQAIAEQYKGQMAMYQARQQRAQSYISAFGTMVGAYATQSLITSQAAKQAELIKTNAANTANLIKNNALNQKIIIDTLNQNNINILDQMNKNATTMINKGYDLGLKHANEWGGF